MAEFEMQSGGGSSPGGGPAPSSRKKGFKVDKTIIYVVGAVVIVIFLLIKGKSNTQAQETPAETYITDGYPDNNVNTQAQLSNFQDIMTGQVDATLNGFSADLNSELNQLKIDIGEQNKALNDKTSADYQAKLDAIAKQNEQLAAQIKNASSSPAPAPVAAPAPAPAPAKVTPTPAGIVYAVPKGGWNGNSIVDYLKSHGYQNDFNSRAQLAARMGISGYRGTAAQNTDMLRRLKAGG
jgi:hypothetical protein